MRCILDIKPLLEHSTHNAIETLLLINHKKLLLAFYIKRFLEMH